MSLILRNLMEDIVISNIDNLIDDLNVCSCEQCRLDIASYTLNRLPAKYVATTQGEILAKLDSLDTHFEALIVTTIAQAATVVRQHPRHKNP